MKKDKITRQVEVDIPRVPNYIFVGGRAVGIKEFTKEELQKIGEKWTIDLIKKGARA